MYVTVAEFVAVICGCVAFGVTVGASAVAMLRVDRDNDTEEEDDEQ